VAENMNIFFDTEFTGLVSEPRLMSLGFVADDRRELYIELTDGWSESQCSPWVLQHVMPLLGGGERLTRREAVERLVGWLSAYDAPTLLGDSDWDTLLLAALLKEYGVAVDRLRVQQLALGARHQALAFEAAKKSYYEALNAKPHHALTDARAFRAAWNTVIDMN
jgi:hypothetical protein